jgi:type I restriction enzyme, S subunit
MTPATLITTHLDTWTSAIKSKSSAGRGGGKKQEFHGIKKLRELILELAVRGLLVPQDPTEISAEKCLEEAESGVIAFKPDSERAVPDGWLALPLGCVIASNTGGGTPSKGNTSYWGGGIPWASVKDIKGAKYIDGTVDSITEEGLKNSSSNLILPNRLIVVTRMGLGKLAINKIPIAINQDLRAVETTKALSLDYGYVLFKTLNLIGKGVTVKGITVKDLHDIEVLLPPLAEQHRIVAKVDELMALCDQLEQRQEDNTRTHAALVETLLSALTAAKDHRAFTDAWQQIAAHFHTLFTTESSIDQLKQTILQLAVMGKLVEQEPGRSIAIWVTMEELVGRKNLKNGLSLTPVSGPSDFVCLPLSAMNEATIDCNFGKPISIEPDRAEPYLITEGDIFIIRGNGSKERVGVAGMARSCPPNVLFPDLFIRVPLPPDKIDGDYFLIAWNNATTRKRLEALATTTSGIWKVNQGHISECEIPLPPLAEQHRIVAKVDELMALCDRLKARLQSAQTTQLHFADSLVEAVIH